MPEVVVVGASVAGAATAIHLARRGREVLLVDRSEFPRRKPCGEGLFPAGVRQLRELGLLDRLDGAMIIESLRFQGYGAAAEAGLGSPDAPAIGVRRSVLDHVLLRAAAEAGARVALGGGPSQLQVEEDGRFSLRSEQKVSACPAMIVAADGLGSGLRRAAGLDPKLRGRRYGVTAHVELRKPPEPAVEVHFRPGFEVYVTPVGGRCVNVAVLMSKPMTKLLAGAADGAMEELLHRESCLPAGWRLLDAPLVAGPFPVLPRSLWARNLVLAGDAAGFFDGITGEGMSLALVSARDCAEAVDTYLRDGETSAFREYERRRRALARNSERLGRLTLMLSGRPWTARRAIRGLGRRADAFTRMVAVSSGEQGLRGLRPLDLLAPFLG
jgi:flavin-dependent dehydrogenase